MELRRYQKRAIEFGMSKKNVFDMIDLGLGKTVIALKRAEYMRTKLLVVAPLRVAAITWPIETRKWTNLSHTLLHGKDKDMRARLDVDVYLINYEGLKWFFMQCVEGKFKPRNLMVVFDESTFVKNPSTVRFKLLKKMAVLFGSYKYCLSATPSPNGLHDLWSQYFLLDKGERLGRFYSHYRDKHFVYTGAPRYQTIIQPHARESIYAKVKDITFRLDAIDHLSMPDLVYNDVIVEMTPKIHGYYRTLKREGMLSIQGHDIVATTVGTETLKFRQITQGAAYINPQGEYIELHEEKLNALVELIETNEGVNFLCPINFKFEVDMIRRKFPHAPVIHGGTNANASRYTVEKWNAGKIPLLLCHPQSVGHGLNLQEGGHNIIWYSLPWSLEHYRQLVGRLYRSGQKNTVVVTHIVAARTVDIRMATVVKNKDATQQEFLDAMRGVHDD